MNILYRTAAPTDITAVTKLLQLSLLPVADIQSSTVEFFVAVNEASEIAGCIGMEVYDSDGLLRSFAVAAPYRNQKIGSELLVRLFEYCRLKNIRSLHLLTTTAARYFSAAGFVERVREEARQPFSKQPNFLPFALPHLYI